MTMLPPPQYDHLPTIPVIEHVLTADAVNRICHERHALDMAGRPASPGYRFSGCAHVTVGPSGKSCEVWRIDDATVRRHENGHCNGWSAHHPTAKELAKELANRPATPFIHGANGPPPPPDPKMFEEVWQRSIQRNGPPDAYVKQMLEKL